MTSELYECGVRAMRFGRVDTLGQYISEFDPEPDSGKKGLGIHCSPTS